MKQIVECVPNFSEGRRLEVIDQIVAAIEQVQGVKGRPTWCPLCLLPG